MQTDLDAAQRHLTALAGPDARLRADQIEALDAVVGHRKRVLIVQRTGYGKSAIYFIAAKLLRDAGGGPVLLISPLLALMRDQVAAAERMGLRSVTINSTNIDDWPAIEEAIAAGDVDLVCISPERLNNPGFVRRVLPHLAPTLSALAVDEAHCISDWGHDFRPDYRRVRDAIANLAEGTPIIAATATANQRVIDDVADQLGTDVVLLRGPLDRESLHLGVARLPSPAERLAWLAARIPGVDGTGIVYTLTVAQTTQVAEFLCAHGIDAVPYSSDTPPAEREALEARFKANDLKVLVATSALGMGVDKPDVTFVYHLGSPSSPVAYYQQVGRAGRNVPFAEAILLPSDEDRRIWDWFAAVAMPPEPLVQRTLDSLGEMPVSLSELERVVDLRRTRLETLLKILDVDGAVERVDGGWARTGRPWSYDHERIARIRAARQAEAEAMVAYAGATSCLMEQLRSALDDPGAEPCGRCCVCTGTSADALADPALVADAIAYLRTIDTPLEPRKQWPRGLPEPRGNIKPDRRAAEGRALCRSGDAGWWPLVDATISSASVGDELITGIAATLKRWPWEERPDVITWVPTSDDTLIRTVAERLGELGRLPVRLLLARTRDLRSQQDMENSAHRLRNVWGAFRAEPAEGARVLVLDTVYDSGWTMTVAAAVLREAGAAAVLPFALVRQ